MDPNHRQLIKDMISDHMARHERSLQSEIGVSEVGTPCVRKLVYKLGGMPETNERKNSWRPTVGTAVHAWLAEACLAYNATYDIERFLVERSVSPGEIDGVPLTGHGDVYDVASKTVLDWKVVGPTTLKDVRAHGPSITYRVQIHGYGEGFSALGHEVETVAIVYLPSNGELSDMVYWSEPFQPAIIARALSRATHLVQAAKLIGWGELARLSFTATDYCEHCPWFAPDQVSETPEKGRCNGSPEIMAERTMRASVSPPSAFPPIGRK
jgi:hypothetical protein